MKQLTMKLFSPLARKRLRLALRTLAWVFESALISLGAVLAIPFIYRGFDMDGTFTAINNFIEHIIWRDNKDALIDGLWLALLILFLVTCVLRLPAWRSTRSFESTRQS